MFLQVAELYELFFTNLTNMISLVAVDQAYGFSPECMRRCLLKKSFFEGQVFWEFIFSLNSLLTPSLSNKCGNKDQSAKPPAGIFILYFWHKCGPCYFSTYSKYCKHSQYIIHCNTLQYSNGKPSEQGKYFKMRENLLHWSIEVKWYNFKAEEKNYNISEGILDLILLQLPDHKYHSLDALLYLSPSVWAAWWCGDAVCQHLSNTCRFC